MKGKPGVGFAVWLGALLLTAGCAVTRYQLSRPERPVRMTGYSEAEGYRMTRRFRVEVRRDNFAWGMSPDRSVTLDSILDRELKQNEAAGSLKITEVYTFLNALFEFISIGVYRPYTVIVEGEAYEKVSQSPKEAPAGPPTDTPKAERKEGKQ